MFDFAKWFRKTFRSDACFTQLRRLARRRKTPLRLEQLEERLVPTIVFQPQFGSEQAFYNMSSSHGNGPVLSDAPVYLIFWGSYWNTSTGSASEKKLVNAINSELNSPIYNKLSQYKDNNGNSAGPAYVWGSTPTGGNPVYWTATEKNDPSSGFSDSQLQNVVTASINDPYSPIYSPSTTEEVDGGHAPIYFVITPPGIDSSKGQYIYGYHSDFNTTSLNGSNQDVVYGWAGTGLVSSYNTQDLVTATASHEIGEALTDPGVGTNHVAWGVLAGANYHLYPGEGNYGEIGDYEPEYETVNPSISPPDVLSYSYRLNGSLTQALWDKNANADTVSDGTSQNFYVVPQYNSLGEYVGNELDIKGDQQGAGSDDTVEVFTASNGGLMVRLNYETVVFDPGQITSLHIAAGGGSNSISVLSTPQGMKTSIDCEGSNDTVNVGNYVADTDLGSGFLGDLQGAVSVSGSGTYHLDVDDSGELYGQSVSLTNNGNGVGQIIVGGAAPITYSGAHGSLDVFGSRGGDTFRVYNTTGLPTTINTGAGNDTVKVYATTDSLSINNTGGNDSTNVGLGNTDLIKGSVSVFGSGTCALVVDDHMDGTARNATLTSTQLTGLGNTGVIYYWGDVTSLAIDGGAGNNTFNISNGNPNSSLSVPVAVNGGAGNDTFNIGAGDLDYLSGGVTVNGGGGSNTVLVNDKNIPYTDTYTITGSTISRPFFSGLTYSNVQAVILDGESGGNIYDVNSTAAGTTYTFNGGAGSDTFNLSNGILDSLAGAVKVNGGGGSNTLIVNDEDSTDTNSYTITGSTISSQVFAGVTYGGVHTVLLTGGLGGNVFNVKSTAAGTAYNIDGSMAYSTLVGPNSVNTWNLTGVNAGNLNGSFAFTGIENLTGGTAMDVFKFSNGASVSGVINGGGGGDWLDYAAYTSAISVNLTSRTASHTGGISNIQNVRGGLGGSTLTGNAQGNILVGGAGVDSIQGGSGRSVLIGGGGADHVKGGSNDDIIIGGTTNYDANDLALMSILAEWQSGNTYAVRISHLKNGGGLNGSNKLVFGTTVHDDGAANSLTGGAGMNWFFKGVHDTITDLQPGEQVN